MTSSINRKYSTAKLGPSYGHRQQAQKPWRSSDEWFLRYALTETDRQTHGHAHYNTPLRTGRREKTEHHGTGPEVRINGSRHVETVWSNTEQGQGSQMKMSHVLKAVFNGSADGHFSRIAVYRYKYTNGGER